VTTVSYAVGERTELVDTGRHGTLRRLPIAWSLLALVLAAAAIGGWLLYEQASLAHDEAADARLRLAVANARAAAAENQLLASNAARLRAPAPTADPDLDALARALRGSIDRTAGDVTVENGQVLVTLDDPDLFRGDDAELTRRGEAVIARIAVVLVGAGDRAVWVRGHLDDAPLPDDAPFDSAWELSSARALAVVRSLASAGLDPNRLAAVAFGSTRPLGPDRARNRRLELLIGPRASPGRG